MPLQLETLEVMLTDLKNNQETMREEYTKKIEQLDGKIDKILDKLENLPSQYITRTEFENTKEKVQHMEDNWRKIIRIIVTAVIWAVLSLIFIKW